MPYVNQSKKRFVRKRWASRLINFRKRENKLNFKMRMKKILLFVAVAFMSLNVSAQVISQVKKAPVGVLQQKAAQSFKDKKQNAPRKIEVGANQALMGGYTSNSLAAADDGIGLPNFPGTLRAAIFLPADYLKTYNGTKFVAIRFGLCQPIGASRVFVVLINEGGGIGEEIVSQNVASATTGWTDVVLDNQPVLNTEGLDGILMGFDYTQLDDTQAYESYPLSLVSEGTNRYPTYIYGNLGQGEGWYDVQAEDYGNLSVQAVMEGDFPENAVTPLNFGEHVALINGSVDVEIPLFNNGKSISSIDYIITTDGVDGEEQHYDFATPFNVLNAATSITLSFAAASEPIAQEKKLKVTKVNGVENGMNADPAEGKLLTVSQIPNRKIVMEEYTGTWCQWCPRGMVAMDELPNRYPDNFIGIAVHWPASGTSEPMQVADYSDLISTVGGFPAAYVNRYRATDAYCGDNINGKFNIPEVIDEELAKPVEGRIDVIGVWANEEKTEINVRSESKFFLNRDDAPYSVIYVLTEDGLTGGGSAWAQSNAYYDYKGSDYFHDVEGMLKFINGGKRVAGLEYNHVLIAAQNALNGVSGSITSPIVKDAVQSHETTFSLVGNKVMQNPDNIKVIALLYNSSRGEIINADAKHIVTSETSITDINKGDAHEVARYSLDGRQLNAPQKGVNIVRLSNGKTVKVVVE